MLLRRNESFREYLLLYPITSTIIAINVSFFIFTSIKGGLSNPDIFYDLGGIIHKNITLGEYYRVVTYAFIHNGFTHLFFNMFFIALLGSPIEKIFGTWKYISLFLLSIFASFLFIYYFSIDETVGASGFDMALTGVFLSWIMMKKSFMDSASKQMILSIIVISWLSPIFNPNVSISGHLGGFICGFVIGFIFPLDESFASKSEIIDKL